MAVPSAPQNLTATFERAFAATQGLLKWSLPVNLGGLPVLSYEVAVAEGGISYGTETLNFDSTTLAPPDVAGTDDGIDFGDLSAVEGISREAVGDGYVYHVSIAITNLRIRANGTVNLGTAVVCRYAATQPTAANFATHGSELWNVGTQSNAFSGDGTIASAAAGTYFWVYTTGDPRTITHRRLRLTGESQVVNWTAPWVDTQSNRTRYLAKELARGTEHTFAVRAKNADGVGPASTPVTERTPICSIHNALFFEDCVNYFDQGARIREYGNVSHILREAGDNDYQTYTDVTDMVIDMSVGGQPTRVDAVFVKGIGIDSHAAVATGGIGTGYSARVVPATVTNWEGTEVSTIINGFQHDLYLVPEPFTATSVRMTFTGTDAKITEIMLLAFGVEINANGDLIEINPEFVDRVGIVHPDAGGGQMYDYVIADTRNKWEIEYVTKMVPGKTLIDTPEAFLYWRMNNRNCVHAQEPTRFPGRIWPAVLPDARVSVRYRTDDKNAGEVMSFKVAER